MSTRRTAARIGAAAATATAAAILAGGTALAAGLGHDSGLPNPAVDTAATVVSVPQALTSPSPTPSPSDPVSTVTSTINGLVATAKDTLGLGPKPTASPSPSATVAPGPVPVPRPRPQPAPRTVPGGTPALPRTSGSISTPTGGLPAFGSGLGDRRPALINLPVPAPETVHGIGAVAVPALPRSVSDALPGDSSDPGSLPGLLVVCAAACVAAVAAGNAEVWRRRLAERLS